MPSTVVETFKREPARQALICLRDYTAQVDLIELKLL
jgi:hypothetical protein